MAIQGCSFEEVENFNKEIEIARRKLKEDDSYQEDVINGGKIYKSLKNFIDNFTNFLRYTEELHISSLYRVRRNDGETPYSNLSDLIYPPANKHHKDRMNNYSFRVLYTSLNELTAMAETRLSNEDIGRCFQLTRFKVHRPIKAFKIGVFSDLYLNTPRDSTYYLFKMKELFGESGHDLTIRGYAAIENAIANILYDSDPGYHYLSSIVADSIFSANPQVEAIYYPTMQNRYGINLAANEKLANELIVECTSMNKLEAVYSNGFYKYKTLMSSKNNNMDTFDFEKINGSICYR